MEEMGKKLMDVSFPTKPTMVQVDGKMRVVPGRGQWDHSMFLNSDRLKKMISIASNYHESRLKPLGEDAHKFLNFDEPICMDFSQPEATPLAFTDELVEGMSGDPEEMRMLKEVLAPLRRTTIKDRSTRYMPHRWKLYPKCRMP